MFRLSSVLLRLARRSLLVRKFVPILNLRHLTPRNRFQLVTGRTWRGSAFGGVKGRTELPGLVEGLINGLGSTVNLINHSDYLAGKVRVDEYVTHHRKFDEINEGFNDMHVCRFPYCMYLILTRNNRLAIASDVLWTCPEVECKDRKCMLIVVTNKCIHGTLMRAAETCKEEFQVELRSIAYLAMMKRTDGPYQSWLRRLLPDPMTALTMSSKRSCQYRFCFPSLSS